jgi:tetratricopeptide (TPR) repeat protein
MATRSKASRRLTTRTPAKAPRRNPRRVSARQFDWLIAAGLVLLMAVAYVQVVNFEFTNYDDTAYVPENAHVRDGFSLGGIGWACTTFETANWYPLTWLSLMLDCQLFGPRPGVHHAVNVLLHAADAVLLYMALRRMTGRRWPSAAVAALFAVHPLHVESVAWIAERKDVLSTLFFLLAIIAYDRYAARPGLARWSLVFLSMAVGLLCKPMLVTLPFVLLLLDYWPLRGREGETRGRGDGETESQQRGDSAIDRRSNFSASPPPPLSASLVPSAVHRPLWLLLVEKLPLLALSAAAAVVTMIAQASQGATKMIGDKVTLPMQLANAAIAYVKYLAMTFWPVNLAAFYPYDFRPRLALLIASIALLAIVTAAALWLLRRAPYVAVGWFWFLGTLVPTIGLVQVGAQSLADRYMYIPSIGIFIAAVWLVTDLLSIPSAASVGCVERTGEEMVRSARAILPDDVYRRVEPVRATHRLRASVLHAPYACAIAAILALLLVMAHKQTSYWINSEQLFRHALAVTGDNPESCENLGDTLLHHDRFAEAEMQLRKVLAMDAEQFRQTPAELAQALAGQNRVREAVALIHESIPDKVERAKALTKAGMLLALRYQLAEGIPLLQEAIQTAPEQSEPYRSLAYIYATCPRTEVRDGPKAVELARKACELTDWCNAQCRVTLADAYHEIHDREHEIEELQAAQKLSPKDAAIAARLKTASSH